MKLSLLINLLQSIEVAHDGELLVNAELQSDGLFWSGPITGISLGAGLKSITLTGNRRAV